MKIIDGRTTRTLAADDPVARKIRALLLRNTHGPGLSFDAIAALWVECNAEQRELLLTVATAGDMSQKALEHALGDITGVGLRGRTVSLSKLCKRLGIANPVSSSNNYRGTRRFSVTPEFASRLLKLHAQLKGKSL